MKVQNKPSYNHISLYNHYMLAFLSTCQSNYEDIRKTINQLARSILISPAKQPIIIKEVGKTYTPISTRNKKRLMTHDSRNQPVKKFQKRVVEIRMVESPSSSAASIKTHEVYSFKLKPQEVAEQYIKLISFRNSTNHIKVKHAGGAVNVGSLVLKKRPNEKVGCILAANGGLPGGALNYRIGKVTSEDMKMNTQEESVWANAILTVCGEDSDLQIDYHKATIKAKWGMNEQNSLSTKTIQGIDFTTTQNADDYNQVFMFSNGFLSAVDKDKKIISNSKYPVVFAFADSINANPDIGTKKGTMQRTLNKRAINDYGFFRECVKQKLRSALDGLANEGVTIPLVALLSCGIYAGKHQKAITGDFETVLQEVLTEEVGPNKEKRGFYFRQVIIPLI